MERGPVRLHALAALLLAAGPAHAALTPDQLARAVARPPAGARLPAAVAFTDVRDGRESLGQVAAGRPLVLVFADYTCRHVCAPGLSLLAGSLAQTGLSPDRDYALAIVGLDPRDGRADALRMVARLGSLAREAHVLLGDPAATPVAERALGYGTAYDADADQWAHDASVYVFAADGRLTALLPELGAEPAMLKAAIGGASVRPSFTDRIARLCYGLGAAHGPFGRVAWYGMQAAALLTIAGAFLLLRRRRAA